MANRRLRPTLFLIVAGLFALAAVRDAFFPHFFALGDGHPIGNAALAVCFMIFGVRAFSRSHPAASPVGRGPASL